MPQSALSGSDWEPSCKVIGHVQTENLLRGCCTAECAAITDRLQSHQPQSKQALFMWPSEEQQNRAAPLKDGLPWWSNQALHHQGSHVTTCLSGPPPFCVIVAAQQHKFYVVWDFPCVKLCILSIHIKKMKLCRNKY